MIRYLYPWIIMLTLFVAFSGCDNSLDPIDEDRGRYSIYGYLDLYKNVNHIRVKDLNTTLLEDSTNKIDAEVTLENMNNGATQKLKDTIIEFDGVKTHNFRTTMEIQPNTEYRLSVERSDGKTTSATATAPHIAERNVSPIGANCTTRVAVNFDPVSSRNALDLEIGFYYNRKEFWVPVNRFFVESDEGVTASFIPWDILDNVFGPGGSKDVIPEDELEVFCDQLDDQFLMGRYVHYGPDLLSNTISDTLRIPGGAGRFGALYSDAFSFRIDTTSLCPPQQPEECDVLSD